jgi:hypothetical protein
MRGNKKYESGELGEGGVLNYGDEGMLEQLRHCVSVPRVLLEADLYEVLGVL